MRKFDLPQNSLMFAPMEGVTDEAYRITIAEQYPHWDTYSCDFLRVPSTAPYPIKHIKKHFGNHIYERKEIFDKSIYQILTSPIAHTQVTVQEIEKLGNTWLDLNLGCPSKTVCKNHGGSFLLSQLDELKVIIKTIRSNFNGVFTCKIRVGYRDDTQFENILKLLEDEGVDAIKIHARTRDELYKGVAKWEYVKKAVEISNIPIIGNGDIWTTEDIAKYFEYTGCHSIMLARSALKTPWLAELYKENLIETPELRVQKLTEYFQEFFKNIQTYQNLPESAQIKRLKSISRYLFDDLPHGDQYKRRFLLSKEYAQQVEVLQELQKEVLGHTI